MNLMEQNNKLFIEVLREGDQNEIKGKYNSLVMIQKLKNITFDVKLLNTYDKSKLIEIAIIFNKIIIDNNLNTSKINKSSNVKKGLKNKGIESQ